MTQVPQQPDLLSDSSDLEGHEQGSVSETKKRLKPGERRIQILETLAMMLEQPGSERVTTAALAAQLGVSEAALYRHFASKAQMFEGLIDFIEESVYHLVSQIVAREGEGLQKAQRMVAMLLQFAEKNPGMARVMVGDALFLENDRLHQRMNHFFDRIESSLRQVIRESTWAQASSTPTVATQQRASVWVSFVTGRMHRFVRSGFKRLPTEHLEASLAQLLA
jgi:TetR/AcrR family transcriptional regulator